MTELERARPWIEAALEHAGGTHTWDDIVAGIADWRFQFWPGERGCLVTEIIDFPQKRVLNVFLGGGAMRELLAMAPDVTAWAKAQGCTSLSINGRRGWERVFARHGWRPLYVSLTKEIEP